ncbi:MAG: hypothetical protein JWP02_3385 [Acidimicrobiales bacterium]|nr:hypothetical protein [Acidimicrobiales bacterium]
MALAILVGTLLGVARTPARPGTGFLVRTFDGRTSLLDRQLVRGDGQAYAALARDPGLRRPDVFRGGPQEAAYRAQRPLYSYLAWAASGGRPGAVPLALLGINLLAAAGAAAAVAALSVALGSPWWLGPAVLLLPGALVPLNWSTADVLGLAIAVAGLWLWVRPQRRTWLAAACFAAAGLCRETYLVVPFALGVEALWRHRDGIRPILVSLVLTPVPYLAWIVVVHARYGAWPLGSRLGAATAHRLAAPGFGIIEAAHGWGPSEIFNAAALVVIFALAVRRRRPWIFGVVAGYAALALVLGRDVWDFWHAFSRILLPLEVLGLVLICSRPATRFRPSGQPE